jgi:hypothetical protein
VAPISAQPRARWSGCLGGTEEQGDQAHQDAGRARVEEELGRAGVFADHVLPDRQDREGENRQRKRAEQEWLAPGPQAGQAGVLPEKTA